MRFWEHWINQNKEQIVNQSVKSVQSDKRLIILELENKNYINISVYPQLPLIFLSHQQRQLPIFQKFNDYLVSSQILDINLKEDDNIVIIGLKRMNILGEIFDYQMIVELIPRFTNIILLKENLVKLAYSYFNKNDNPIRQILINQKYQWPPLPKKLNDLPFQKKIMDGNPCREEMNTRIQEYFTDRLKDISQTDFKKEYISILKNFIKKKDKLITNLEKDLSKTDHYEDLQKKGLLLQSNLYQIENGSEKVVLIDYMNNNQEVELELDPNLTPSENVERFFSEYKKKAKSIAQIEKRIQITKKEIQEFEDELRDVDKKNEQSIKNRIKELRQNHEYKKSILETRLPYHEFILSSGKKALVGKTSKDNDHLTLKIAKPFDYWFHARDYKGSHLILEMKNKDEILNKKDIEEAAGIAAYFSKAKHAGLAPVDYTLKKYVRKPKNSAPGFVVFKNEKTVLVEPKIK